MELDLRVVAVLLSGMATMLAGGIGILLRVSRWHAQVTSNMARLQEDVRYLRERSERDHDKITAMKSEMSIRNRGDV